MAVASTKLTIKEVPGIDHLYNDSVNVIEAVESLCKCA